MPTTIPRRWRARSQVRWTPPGSIRNLQAALSWFSTTPRWSRPKRCNAAVLRMLDWLPERSQLAVASRCEPALPLGRMRAQRLLLEFGSADLSMSAIEAGVAAGAAGPGSRAQADADPRGALRGLAGRARTRGDSRGRVSVSRPSRAQLRGDDHLISEYFRAELLDSCPPASRRFSDALLRPRTSVGTGRATRWSAARARHGCSPSSPGPTFRLQPVDSSHESFRLHGLFREMLQTELRRSEPELAPLLHRRASEWYADAGDMSRAIDHARSADDLGRVGNLLWRHLHQFLGEGRNELVQGWLRGIDAERAAGCYELALAAAHSGLALGSVTMAEQWARSAAVGLSETAEEPPTSVPCRLAADRSVGGPLRRQADGRSCRTGVRPAGGRRSRGGRAAAFCRAAPRCWSVTGREAERLLEEGAGRGDRQAPDAASLCLAQLAVCAAERNDPRGRIGLRSPRALDGRLARLAHRAGLGAGAGGLRCIRDARGPSRRGESGGV